MITGRFVSKKRRYLVGLIGCALILAVLLPLLLGGRLDLIEYRGLDWLHRNFPETSKVSSDIVIVYIDQKSIDAFRHGMGVGWPWPRDFYGRAAWYLHAAGAKAVVFDATFSEPSVFADDYGDDQAFAQAMSASGRVFQTLMFHKHKKDAGALADEEALARLAGRGLDYRGPPPESYADVTMPIKVLEEAAWGLGDITIEPEADGVVRRLRPLAGFQGRTFATLSLAVYLKINDQSTLVRSAKGLQAGPAVLPLDGEDKTLIKYYGGPGVYEEFNFAAVIQSAMQLEAGEKPLVPLASFKDKIVFIGAKAAALYDLRSTPVADALPGVEIHAAFLNNLLAGDFLSRASPRLSGLVIALFFLATLSAAILTGSVLAGAGLGLGLGALYVAVCILAFRHNIWLDMVSPLGGQTAVFILAGLINYYGEGREKRAVRGAFSRYLSPQVVSEVLENPEMLSLGGSRRVMTAFFSDIAGFTTISESLSPEELVHLLNRYLSLMTRAITDRGGTVDKFEGDAIMAFWGAPLPQEDHARQACLAALDQQAILAEFREETAAEGLPELRVRMGLNTGPMIVGNMGSEERFDYTIMGDAVNLASRLEGANKAYETYVMISESTYEEVKDAVEVRELDLIRVKGKNEPIRVFELIAPAGKISSVKTEIRSGFKEGLALYRDMDFIGAEKAFTRVLSLDPEDGPAKIYVKRCLACQQNPPLPDWDRVFTMTTK